MPARAAKVAARVAPTDIASRYCTQSRSERYKVACNVTMAVNGANVETMRRQELAGQHPRDHGRDNGLHAEEQVIPLTARSPHRTPNVTGCPQDRRPQVPGRVIPLRHGGTTSSVPFARLAGHKRVGPTLVVWGKRRK